MSCSFLDESRNTDLIRWSDDGNSFIVLDEDEFARTLIPELFKHNNYASFVRQLNMYGFHKRVGLSDNSMRASERKNKTPSEYSNPYFKRGRPLLLWLIQKPKTTNSKAKGRTKQEENADEEIDDTFDTDPYAEHGHSETARDQRHPLMISQSGGQGLQESEIKHVNTQLRQIQQQQQAITAMLTKIRKEHDQMYNQAAAFTELHTRHENSINAILTFLATIYNRSLQGGQGSQNMANLFSGASLPHDQAGNIINVPGLVPDTNLDGTVHTRGRRQPLLLQAPDDQRIQSISSPDNQGGGNVRPGSANTGFARSPSNPQTGVVEEIYDADTPGRPSPNSQWSANSPQTQADIMSLINSTNAQDNSNSQGRMNFPQALSHLQNADGKTPLSPQQRDTMLQRIANSQGGTGADGNNNALMSPAPPNVPNLDKWNATDRQLEALERTLKAQENDVAQLSNMLQPLSPSGSIPGLHDGQYIPPPDGLDLNQLFDTDQYFNNDPNYNFDSNDGFDYSEPAFNFDDPSGDGADFNWNNQNSGGQTGRVVETAGSSKTTSPANTAEDGQTGDDGRNLRKRRRQN